MVKLTPEKAIIIGKVAVIADLHLGFENVMQEKGVAIPRMQIDDIITEVERIAEIYGIERIIVAGDLKHEFSRNLPYEWEDVRKFIEFLDSINVDLSVVRGNHDNFLAAILADYGIELREYERLGDYHVVHGHKDVEFEEVIAAHEHPAVKLRVRGGIYSYPCFLRIDKTKYILPAFSPLMSGSDILQGDFLSPLLKKARKIEVFAIEDEVFYLGELRDLREALAELDYLG
jgi:hypothetical protein